MRTLFAVLFFIMSIALCGCAFFSHRSKKSIAPAVTAFVGALIFPVIGNLIIVLATERRLAVFGCYVYFIGMDFVMFALIGFTTRYCAVSKRWNIMRILADALLAADVIQFCLNPVFGQAFDVEAIMVEGAPYYRLLPYLGQTFHRVVDYIIYLSALAIFLRRTVKSTSIYVERYAVILVSMIATGLLQTFFIFSREPVDRSMVCYGLFGMLVFYFSLYYRPVRALDRILSNIVSDMTEALYVYDINCRCIWANAKGLELLHISESQVDRVPECLEALYGHLDFDGQDWAVCHYIGTGDEAKYYSLEKRTVVYNGRQNAGFYLSVRDNTKEKQELAREMYNSTHDGLTGLYTREYLYENIHNAMQTGEQLDYLIVFVDVKNFKIVNDIFGNKFGDFALQRIADWIRKGMSERCIYGRLAGDTFGVCIPVGEFQASALEEELENFVVDDGSASHKVLIHLGVYQPMEEDRDLDVSVMFDRAHLALGTIRDEYRTHIAYYDKDIRDKVLWDQQISAQLREALAQKQILPYLQPIVDPDGKIVGAEALVRWKHPEFGFLSPAAFITVFEKNGMIVDVDRYMWRCACEILSRWEQEGCGLFLSVNISPKDFYFMDVTAEIIGLVKEYGIRPEKLRVEITETVMMTDVDNRMRILGELREAGFLVEMDDFGSGYSSLNMLKDMPVDVLKIDMKFLGKAKDDDKARTIVKNIINLSDDLIIASLTEGVETLEQFQMLSDMGCKMFQGYYFAKPMAVQEFEEKFTA